MNNFNAGLPEVIFLIHLNTNIYKVIKQIKFKLNLQEALDFNWII